MKQLITLSKASKKYLAVAALFLYQGVLWAQETKEVDVKLSVDDGGGEWYVQPWAWIVGAAVFILLLVALLKSGSKKD